MKIKDIGKFLTVKQSPKKATQYHAYSAITHTVLHTSYTVFMRKSNECFMHVNDQSAFKINDSLHVKSRRLIGKKIQSQLILCTEI